MSESGLAVCDHVFGFECSGEVTNLIHAAERYGIMIEKAKTRIDAICRQCRRFSSTGAGRIRDERLEEEMT